jgi:hypothetical protein
VRAFERRRGIPVNSVHDLLRGRPSARVSRAVEDFLGTPISISHESDLSDSSRKRARTHRLNERAA